MVPVYGPDGTEYPSYDAAIAAGVTNPSYTKPVTAPRANIPTYGAELARLMGQYGVQSPVAPRTTDQSLIDQYFTKVNQPQYQRPAGNALYNQYLGIGMGELPAPAGPMTNFFPGQAVCPDGQRFDPVTARCIAVSTGTPNVGGNQCPPGFTYNATTRSCVPGPGTGLPVSQTPPAQATQPVAKPPVRCQPGYVADATGKCVPDPEQVALINKYFGKDAYGYDLQSLVQQGKLNTNVARDVIGASTVDPWLAKNVEPDKSFSDYAIQNLAAQSSYGPEKLYNLYKQGSVGMGEIEQALGQGAVQNWMQQYKPEEAKQLYGMADGGSVDMDQLIRKYQIGGFNELSPGTVPARQQYEEAASRLRSAVEDLSKGVATKPPSKAEMYFRLASAFATPTKTGDFGESLGLAAGELGRFRGEQREAQSATAEQRRNLALELAKFDVERAQEIMRAETQAARPASEIGRACQDKGLVVGTPDYQACVEAAQAAQQESAQAQADILRDREDRLLAANERANRLAERAASRLSPTEIRMLDESETALMQAQQATDILTKIAELSKSAYTKAIGDVAARAWAEKTSPDSPKVVATRNMENLITLNLLNSLKMMFGSNPTEGERAIALATQGLDAISVDERDNNFEQLATMTEQRRKFLQSRVDELKAGQFATYEESINGE